MPIDLLAQYDEPKDLLAEYEEPKSPSSKGFLGNYADYAKGAGLGIGQGLGDALASMANFPGDIYSHFSGKESPYHVPHPALQQYYPEGTWGNIGSTLGNFEGQVIAPGGVAFKALKAVNNPLAKALMGASAGGLVGSATNEGDRLGSGIAGAALGTGGALANSILKGFANIAPLTKKIASSPYAKKAAYLEKHGIGNDLKVTPEYLDDAERILRNHPSDIPAEAVDDIIPLARAGEHDAIHAVQSSIKSLGRDLSKQGGVAGRLGEKYHSLAEKIMGDVNNQLKESGHKEAVRLEEIGKKRTARYYKQQPMRKMAAKGAAHAAGLGGGYEFLKYLLK